MKQTPPKEGYNNYEHLSYVLRVILCLQEGKIFAGFMCVFMAAWVA